MKTDHPSVLLARRLWLAVADGDAETVKSVLSDDVVWRSYGHNLLAGTYHGPEGVIDYLVKAGDLADDLEGTLDSIFFNDEGAVVIGHVSARRGAKRLDMDTLFVFRIEEGRIARASVVPSDQAENDRFWS